MPGFSARFCQPQQRGEGALALISAVPFRELQCLGVGGFGSRVLIGLEGSVASRERCFNFDARSLLSALGRAGADDEPDRNRRYSGSNRVSI